MDAPSTHSTFKVGMWAHLRCRMDGWVSIKYLLSNYI